MPVQVRGPLQAWRPTAERKAPRAEPANPLLDAILVHVDRVADPLLDRGRRTTDTLAWLAGAVLGGDFRTHSDPLAQLRAVVPVLELATCDTVTTWVVEQDQLVRQAAGIGDDLQLWPGVACPACDHAGVLALRMSGPAEARVVVCTAQGCVCVGEACGCGMPEPVAGISHIWELAQLRKAMAA